MSTYKASINSAGLPEDEHIQAGKNKNPSKMSTPKAIILNSPKMKKSQNIASFVQIVSKFQVKMAAKKGG